jgi:hypothetical protein
VLPLWKDLAGASTQSSMRPHMGYMKKITLLVIALSVFSLLGLNLWSFKSVLPVGQDDTLFSASAHYFIQKGRIQQPMSRLVPALDGEERVYGRILLAGLTATGYLMGPSIFSDRLWSVCMMLLALVILWYIARRLLGSCWGLFVVMLCLAIILLEGRAIVRKKRILWFAAGAAAGALWYVCWHILPNPRSFFEQMSYYSVKEGFSSSGFRSFLERAAQEFYRYMLWFWGNGLQRIRLIEAALIIMGLVYSARSKCRRTRYLGFVTISLVVVQTFLVSRKVVYYLMPIYPLFVFHIVVALRALYIAGKAKSLGRKPGGRILRAAALSGLIAFAGFYTVQELIKVYRNRNTDYERYVSEITSVVPRGVVVAGSPSLWYALGDRNDLVAHISFLWTLNYGYRGVSLPPIADIIEKNKIQMIVVEPFFRELLDSQDGASERSVREFIRTRCRLIKTFKPIGYRGIGECKEGEATQIFTVLP